MERSIRALMCVLLLCPAAALAGHEDTSSSTVDVYHVPHAKLDQRQGQNRDENYGDGYGVRAMLRYGDGLAFTGEASQTSYDDIDVDVDQRRLGAGFVGLSSSGALGGVFLEYDQASSDELGDLDGFSLHGRITGQPRPHVQMWGDVGYMLLESDEEDQNGFEFTIGAAVNFIHSFGIFVDYRHTRLEGGQSALITQIGEARAGIRVSFGGGATGEEGTPASGVAEEPTPVAEEPEAVANEPEPVAEEPAPAEPAEETPADAPEPVDEGAAEEEEPE